MKHLLLTTIAAVLVVGCGESQPQKPPTVKIPDISIHDAVIGGGLNIANVEVAISSGADVNAKNEEGGTPFHLAAEEGHQQIVELLISKNADINARDNKGKTPLNWAATWGLKEIADLLRKHGGKTNRELKVEGK